MLPQKKRIPKLSRQEKMKRNPIPWVVLIIICLIAFGLSFTKIIDWNAKRSQLGALTQEKNDLESEKSSLFEAVQALRTEYKEKAKDDLVIESQLLPNEVNTEKIIQVLETMLTSINKVSLENVSFSTTTESPDGEYRQTAATLTFEAPAGSLKQIINYLQDPTNQPTRGETASDRAFLDANVLPLTVIDSIALNEAQEGDGNYEVQMRVKFFAKNEN